MELTITTEDRDREIVLTGYMRPPNKKEQQAFRHLTMTAMASDGDKAAQAQFGMQFADEMGQMAETMLYAVEGEIPSWASSDTPREFVVEYCQSDITRAAMELMQRAMGGMVDREKREIDATKN